MILPFGAQAPRDSIANEASIPRAPGLLVPWGSIYYQRDLFGLSRTGRVRCHLDFQGPTCPSVHPGILIGSGGTVAVIAEKSKIESVPSRPCMFSGVQWNYCPRHRQVAVNQAARQGRARTARSCIWTVPRVLWAGKGNVSLLPQHILSAGRGDLVSHHVYSPAY
jgi:hypothetical protein